MLVSSQSAPYLLGYHRGPHHPLPRTCHKPAQSPAAGHTQLLRPLSLGCGTRHAIKLGTCTASRNPGNDNVVTARPFNGGASQSAEPIPAATLDLLRSNAKLRQDYLRQLQQQQPQQQEGGGQEQQQRQQYDVMLEDSGLSPEHSMVWYRSHVRAASLLWQVGSVGCVLAGMYFWARWLVRRGRPTDADSAPGTDPDASPTPAASLKPPELPGPFAYFGKPKDGASLPDGIQARSLGAAGRTGGTAVPPAMPKSLGGLVVKPEAVAKSESAPVARPGWWRELPRVYYLNFGSELGLLPKVKLELGSMRETLIGFESLADAEFVAGTIKQNYMDALPEDELAEQVRRIARHTTPSSRPLFLEDMCELQGCALDVLPTGRFKYTDVLSDKALTELFVRELTGSLPARAKERGPTTSSKASTRAPRNVFKKPASASMQMMLNAQRVKVDQAPKSKTSTATQAAAASAAATQPAALGQAALAAPAARSSVDIGIELPSRDSFPGFDMSPTPAEVLSSQEVDPTSASNAAASAAATAAAAVATGATAPPAIAVAASTLSSTTKKPARRRSKESVSAKQPAATSGDQAATAAVSSSPAAATAAAATSATAPAPPTTATAAGDSSPASASSTLLPHSPWELPDPTHPTSPGASSGAAAHRAASPRGPTAESTSSSGASSSVTSTSSGQTTVDDVGSSAGGSTRVEVHVGDQEDVADEASHWPWDDEVEDRSGGGSGGDVVSKAIPSLSFAWPDASRATIDVVADAVVSPAKGVDEEEQQGLRQDGRGDSRATIDVVADAVVSPAKRAAAEEQSGQWQAGRDDSHATIHIVAGAVVSDPATGPAVNAEGRQIELQKGRDHSAGAAGQLRQEEVQGPDSSALDPAQEGSEEELLEPWTLGSADGLDDEPQLQSQQEPALGVAGGWQLAEAGALQEEEREEEVEGESEAPDWLNEYYQLEGVLEAQKEVSQKVDEYRTQAPDADEVERSLAQEGASDANLLRLAQRVSQPEFDLRQEGALRMTVLEDFMRVAGGGQEEEGLLKGQASSTASLGLSAILARANQLQQAVAAASATNATAPSRPSPTSSAQRRVGQSDLLKLQSQLEDLQRQISKLGGAAGSDGSGDSPPPSGVNGRRPDPVVSGSTSSPAFRSATAAAAAAAPSAASTLPSSAVGADNDNDDEGLERAPEAVRRAIAASRGGAIAVRRRSPARPRRFVGSDSPDLSADWGQVVDTLSPEIAVKGIKSGAASNGAGDATNGGAGASARSTDLSNAGRNDARPRASSSGAAGGTATAGGAGSGGSGGGGASSSSGGSRSWGAWGRNKRIEGSGATLLPAAALKADGTTAAAVGQQPQQQQRQRQAGTDGSGASRPDPAELTGRTADGATIVSRRTGRDRPKPVQRDPAAKHADLRDALQLAAAEVQGDEDGDGGLSSSYDSLDSWSGAAGGSGKPKWWQKKYEALYLPTIRYADGSMGFVQLNVSLATGGGSRKDMRVVTFEDRHDCQHCLTVLKQWPEYQWCDVSAAAMATKSLEQEIANAFEAQGDVNSSVSRPNGIVVFRRGKLGMRVGMSPDEFTQLAVFQAAAQASLVKIGYEFDDF